MSSKKYLSLDEVTGRLGLSSDQVNKLREEGRLRGFADRGTWKFKSDDVEEFARSRQADSAPDVPILDDSLEDDSFVSPSGVKRMSPGSSVISADDDVVGEQPTVIRGDATGSSIYDDEPLLTSSDSDVRLILDDSLMAGDSNPDVSVQGDSDSDVRLMDPKSGVRRSTPAPGGRSDSDVKLMSDEGDTVSDVRLLSGDDLPAAKAGSDSDVALVSPRGKGGGSVFDDEDDMRSLAGDSGIALESIADSGIALDAPSGAGKGKAAFDDSVLAGPGGIESSIIALSEDSGIALSSDSRKGSGIDVGSPTDSGIALEALNDGGMTQPMMRTQGGRRDQGDDTQFEMGSATDDSEFELAESGGSMDSDDTSVILFEDDDAFDVAPVAKKPAGRKQPAVDEYIAAEGDDVIEMEDDFDDFDEEGGSSVVMADDEDLEFEAADEDFDEGFQTGESAADFAPAAQRVAVAAEPEFGVPTFAGLAATSAILVLCGMLMFDLVRSMWNYSDPQLSGWLLNSTKSLF
ncbi:MAG: helix-turn-helix domain-containing protein [Planctomycetota bacterium]|nr:helix-turn-helix domain-containing protein [Planctomycetaceae bacterium]MDQ3333288.1 helix-turn-helix domain-containing protein [Planctomycetota bacterium]